MRNTETTYQLEITKTSKVCPIGQITGRGNIKQGNIPVLSCEGACIRGEIARVAANLIAKEKGFSRACHGELITAPHTEIAKWAKSAGKVVLIDGCFMGCHGRILEGLIGEDNLVRFDALRFHKKYSDLIEIDSVPEEERKATARKVADAVLEELSRQSETRTETETSCGCGAEAESVPGAAASANVCG